MYACEVFAIAVERLRSHTHGQLRPVCSRESEGSRHIVERSPVLPCFRVLHSDQGGAIEIVNIEVL
jgi:hypothetical protein